MMDSWEVLVSVTTFWSRFLSDILFLFLTCQRLISQVAPLADENRPDGRFDGATSSAFYRRSCRWWSTIWSTTASRILTGSHTSWSGRFRSIPDVVAHDLSLANTSWSGCSGTHRNRQNQCHAGTQKALPTREKVVKEKFRLVRRRANPLPGRGASRQGKWTSDLDARRRGDVAEWNDSSLVMSVT